MQRCKPPALAYEFHGGIDAGAQAASNVMNKPFWVKLTAVSGGLYAWTEQQQRGTSPILFIDLPGGRFGTTTINPAIEANGAALTVPSFVRIQQSYYDANLDWVHLVVSESGAGSSVSLIKDSFVVNTPPQSIPSGVVTDLHVWHTGTVGDWTSNGTTFTSSALTQRYIIVVSLAWQANANGSRFARLNLLGTQGTSGTCFRAPDIGFPAPSSGNDLHFMNFTEGEYPGVQGIKVQVLQNSGVSLLCGYNNSDIANYVSFFTVE